MRGRGWAARSGLWTRVLGYPPVGCSDGGSGTGWPSGYDGRRNRALEQLPGGQEHGDRRRQLVNGPALKPNAPTGADAEQRPITGIEKGGVTWQ